MDTPALPPAEVLRLLEGMSFFQKRALKKAGFKWDGLHRLAAAVYGAGLVEAVLACHTEVLGRQPRAEEPEKALTAQRHPGVSAATGSSGTTMDVSASGRGRLNIDPELLAQMEAAKKEKKKADKADKAAKATKTDKSNRDQRQRPGGRELP
jgi:hypothetical protein